MKASVVREFKSRFGADPDRIIRSPGRVNVIGEHTDYNDGFVLPMAIDRSIWVALRPRPDSRVEIFSMDYQSVAAFDLEDITRSPATWSDYVKGVAWLLREEGHDLHGWEGVIGGDVPRGAGLSSSAALELAVTLAFSTVGRLPWNPFDMALLCQRVENEWIGVSCGIMDQLVVACATEGSAVLIDCRSLATDAIPVPGDVRFVVMDTVTRRQLVESAYNERREQCAAAARHFGVSALRDVDANAIEEVGDGIDAVTLRRARHVATENARTLQAADALRSSAPGRLGELMNESHRSLRDEYEVSSSELDTMVDLARRQQSCFGARMTGAGFGGCAVALVEAHATGTFVDAVTLSYRRETGLNAQLYVCRPSRGVHVVSAV